jgi:hypothetical protein
MRGSSINQAGASCGIVPGGRPERGFRGKRDGEDRKKELTRTPEIHNFYKNIKVQEPADE